MACCLSRCDDPRSLRRTLFDRHSIDDHAAFKPRLVRFCSSAVGLVAATFTSAFVFIGVRYGLLTMVSSKLHLSGSQTEAMDRLVEVPAAMTFLLLDFTLTRIHWSSRRFSKELWLATMGGVSFDSMVDIDKHLKAQVAGQFSARLLAFVIQTIVKKLQSLRCKCESYGKPTTQKATKDKLSGKRITIVKLQLKRLCHDTCSFAVDMEIRAIYILLTGFIGILLVSRPLQYLYPSPKLFKKARKEASSISHSHSTPF
ncbi:hypothetical protein Plhal703r1_c20g0089691 [Plasmopara halstedii]